MANAVGVTEDFVVVPGFVAVGIGDVSQADFFHSTRPTKKKEHYSGGCTPKSPKLS